MEPNVAALSGYVGKYEKKLFSTLVKTLSAAIMMMVMPDIKSKLRLTKLRVLNGAKPYSVDFSGSDADLVYSQRDLEVNTGKRELQIDVEQFRQTWLSELQAKGVNPTDLPLAAYVWDQVFKNLAADIETNTVYLGLGPSGIADYNAASTYSAGAKIRFQNNYYLCVSSTTAGQSPSTHAAKWQLANSRFLAKGIGTIIAEEITAGNLSPVSIGSIAASTAKAQFDSFARSMPAEYQAAGFNIYCSRDNWWKFNDDYEDKVGKFVQLNAEGYSLLSGFGDRVKIIPANWMGNSGRLIATPMENLLMGVDSMSDMNNVRIFAPTDWSIKAGIAFRLGFQIRDLDAIKVSDVA